MLGLVSVCLLPGCLEFKSQTMTYQYDKKTDVLRIFQNYMGIIATESKASHDAGEQISDKEKSQLESVINGQRTFFFSNWVYEYDQANYKEMRAELKTPKDQDEAELSPEGLAKMEKVLDAMLKNIRVENGPFYLDSNKQLSAVQYVTISNCSAVMTAINDFAPYLLKEMMNDASSESEKALVANFLKSAQSLVQFEDNALTIRWPISRDEYDKAFGNESDDPEMLADLKRAGFKTSFANDGISLRLGDPDAAINSLSLEVSDKPYNNYLADFVGGQHAIKDALDVSSMAREFLQDGKRMLPNKKK